ncbi:hypothetical protein LCGC14_2113500 [marine sediment metagenome]|uniref:ribonucleoside-diphosphate reductase n=1 Tax=marine sediment metagenome TaxID=412755 RepID=A0A0F9E6D0_9ZZZZ
MSKIFHKEQLAKAVNPKFAEMVFKDSKIKPKFSENALTILRKRYLQSGETPEGMLERVSMGNPDWYNMMARLDFLPNSPTLFNLGTGKGTSSACFVFDIEDSMDHIMHVATKIASVQKWGGGVGMNFSKLRPKGAEVKGTGNHAGGPVAFLKMYNAIGDCITQSGKRNAAQMAILNVYHADIEEWITCKQEDPDSLSTFNMSVEIPDQFMNLVTKGKGNSSDRDIETFNKITEAAWKTGDPGVYFVDRAERDNPTPHLGPLVGPNPCGEVPNRDNEPCNLGSINLLNMIMIKHDGSKGLNLKKLDETVRLAVRYLNAVLDNNQFSHPDITKAAYETRKIGLGVMGWADALATMNIHYDTNEAVGLGKLIMNIIQKTAHDESEKMCEEITEEEGMYPSWQEPAPKRRNATVTCIAPTGTISILANCLEGSTLVHTVEWGKQKIQSLVNKNYSVYCVDESGKPTIKRAFDTKMTQKKAPVYKVQFDTGVFLRAILLNIQNQRHNRLNQFGYLQWAGIYRV